MPALPTLLATLLAIPQAPTLLSLRVSGAATCPSELDIQQRLEPLLAPGQGSGSTIELHAQGQGFGLALLAPDRTTIAVRELAGPRSCDEWASAMAIVIASWLSELTPQSASPVALSLETERGVAHAANHTPGWGLSAALGATAALGAGGFAPGVALELGLAPAKARWALQIIGGYEAPRSLALDPGSVSWSEWTVGAGAVYAVLDRLVRVELAGGAVLGVFELSGSRFSSNLTASALDPGLDLGARCLFLRSALRPWVGLQATGWLREEAPTLSGSSASVSLPRVTVWAGAGLAWRAP